jgi:hypothetical protein
MASANGRPLGKQVPPLGLKSSVGMTIFIGNAASARLKARPFKTSVPLWLCGSVVEFHRM